MLSLSKYIKHLWLSLLVVGMFAITVFVHETGHFLAARSCGMVVDEFSFGFGPKIASYTHDGVCYSIRWIPAGGFVKLPQMANAMVEGAARKMPPAAPLVRAFVGGTGPAMNIVFALLVATILFFTGVPTRKDPPIIGFLLESDAAYSAGIRCGDLVTKVAGTPVSTWTEVHQAAALSFSKEVGIELLRGGAPVLLKLSTETQAETQLKYLPLPPATPLVLDRAVTGGPAEVAGLTAGDKILKADGVEITTLRQLKSLSKQGPFTLLYSREEAVHSTRVSVPPSAQDALVQNLLAIRQHADPQSTSSQP
jgi:regulator of sigma E protease